MNEPLTASQFLALLQTAGGVVALYFLRDIYRDFRDLKKEVGNLKADHGEKLAVLRADVDHLQED